VRGKARQRSPLHTLCFRTRAWRLEKLTFFFFAAVGDGGFQLLELLALIYVQFFLLLGEKQSKEKPLELAKMRNI